MSRKNKPKIPVRKPLAAKPTSQPVPEIANWLQEGFALHRQGKVNDAQIMYERILQTQSNHFDALQLLATVYKQQGKPEIALEYFDKALRVNQTNAAVFNNRGNR
jgi:Tfp pilus assembly protein PilF